jgi:hypothetical protein
MEDNMYFRSLQRRLIHALRSRIGNGLLTERGLARSAGVSQPHMHHILKGVRTLSPEIADRILLALELTVMDLLDAGAREGTAPPALLDHAATAPNHTRLLLGRRGEETGLSLREAWPPRGRSPAPGAPLPPS